MRLGFWLVGLTATVVAAQAFGCGPAFVSTSGVGGAGGGSTSTGTAGGATTGSVSTSTSSTSSGVTCTMPQTLCGSKCTDVSTDPENCKTCGTKCSPNAQCQGGVCFCAGGLDCGPTVGCVAPMTPQHCDGCNPCPHPSVDKCTNKQCICPTGGVDCGGSSCVDTKNDPLNCGGCGNKCTVEQACSGGACVCRPGFVACPMGSQTCVDIEHDPGHCGSCGKACPGSTGKCSVGTCVSDCPGGTMDCNDSCYTPAELNGDPAQCGQCGVVCKPNEACISGVCEPYFVPDCPQQVCPCPACLLVPSTTCCSVMIGSSTVPVCVHGNSCG